LKIAKSLPEDNALRRTFLGASVVSRIIDGGELTDDGKIS
jgi:hypothetical protein